MLDSPPAKIARAYRPVSILDYYVYNDNIIYLTVLMTDTGAPKVSAVPSSFPIVAITPTGNNLPAIAGAIQIKPTGFCALINAPAAL